MIRTTRRRAALCLVLGALGLVLGALVPAWPGAGADAAGGRGDGAARADRGEARGRTSAARKPRGGRGGGRRRATPARRRAPRARPSSVSARPELPGRLREGGENVAPRGETALERELQAALGELLRQRWIKRAVNGVYVVDVASGRELFSFGADRQLNPASNVKLVSTAAALDALGGAFTYRSRLLGPAPDAEGVVHGDLHFVGSADPTLRAGDLVGLAESLYAAGVRRVTGDLVVGAAGLRDTLGRSTVQVSVTGGRAAGDLPWINVHPDSAYFVVDNAARTVTKGRRRTPTVSLRPTAAGAEERVTIVVRGKIRPGQTVRFTRAVPRPGAFLAHTLRASLILAGVDVVGGVRREAHEPDGLVELAVHESAPLATIAARVNKPSSNFLADRVIWTAGAGLYGGEPSNSKGVRAMQAWLASIGVPAGTYRVDNGSGLSYTNHLSCRQIVGVLLATQRDFRVASDFLASLAIGGRDGTIRHRFRGHPSAGRVRAKTGTLTGVSALSGFVSVGGDSTIAFSILSNGYAKRRTRAIRSIHVAMVDEMYRYLARREAARAGVPSEVALPPQPIDGPEGVEDSGPSGEPDVESQEPDESEEIVPEPGGGGAPGGLRPPLEPPFLTF